MATSFDETGGVELVSKTRTLVDLFAGCGGLSLGLEMAGFTTVFMNELNRDARSTYLFNRRDHLLDGKNLEDAGLVSADVGELTKGELATLKRRLARITNKKDSRGDGLVDLSFKDGSSTLDLLAGGPPCQGFSGIGIRRSYSVDRKEIPSNQLYLRMASIIEAFQPRIFLFENVRGILNAKWTKEGGDCVENLIWNSVWKECFSKMDGYQVRWSLVHAKHYGVPQNRPRVLIVGIRDDLFDRWDNDEKNNDPEDAVTCGFLPARKNLADQHALDLERILGDLEDPEVGATLEAIADAAEAARKKGKLTAGLKKMYDASFATHDYPHPVPMDDWHAFRVSADRTSNEPVSLTDHEYSKHAPDIVYKFREMIRHEDGEIPADMRTKKFSQKVLPRQWSEKGPTITATSLPDDYVHYSQPRILTVREWARLQTFPDWYEFKGKRTTGGLRRAGNPREGIHDREVPKYTQIGNAVGLPHRGGPPSMLESGGYGRPAGLTGA